MGLLGMKLYVPWVDVNKHLTLYIFVSINSLKHRSQACLFKWSLAHWSLTFSHPRVWTALSPAGASRFRCFHLLTSSRCWTCSRLASWRRRGQMEWAAGAVWGWEGWGRGAPCGTRRWREWGSPPRHRGHRLSEHPGLVTNPILFCLILVTKTWICLEGG